MTEYENLINHFYKSFNQRDYQSMAECYHNDLLFNDPVFQNLDFKKSCAMWHMLSERGKDLRIETSNVKINGENGQCRWDAWYSFSANGNKVHNIITAVFEFRDGKIVKHNDHFDFWRWSRQALGFPGLLLGWTPLLQNKVRKKAMDGLDKFIASHANYQ